MNAKTVNTLKPIDVDFIGNFLLDLVQDHNEACEKNGCAAVALMAEGYAPDALDYVDYVAGDQSRVRIVTQRGKHFIITVEQREAMKRK